MRSLYQTITAIAVVLTLLIPNWTSASAQSPWAENERGRYIIQLKAGASVDELIAQKLNLTSARVLHRYSAVIVGFAVELPAQAAQALSSDPRVLNVMPDPVVQASAQTTPPGIERIGTLVNPDAKINGVDERVNVNVAVIDTGSGPHPDLNVVGGVDCTGSGTYNDQNGHGTHVAGTIGAIDNTVGVVGVAPGARIWSVKVLGANGSGTGSAILCGIDWITKNLSTTNIKIANMSLGGLASVADDGNCGRTLRDSIHQAICNSVSAGVTYTVAAGNDGQDAAAYFPAMYDEVITVSALVDTDGKAGGLGPGTSVGADDALASFSNFGADVDVIAPGVGILSTVLNGSYAKFNGTSMASPHAAGAAALYLLANPGASPAQVRDALIATGSTTAWSGDRDSFKEPLINVSAFRTSIPAPVVDVHDAEIVSISAPATVTQGASVTASASVRNNATVTDTVTVAFKESPGGYSASRSITLAPGASTTLSFNWSTTTSTATGNHTLTVSASVPNDSNAGNNSRSHTISVQAPTVSNGMYVSDLRLSSTKTSSGTRINTRVTIKSGSSVVSRASVTIRYTDPNGATSSVMATTNRYGHASFSRTVSRKGTYTIEVRNVTKTSYTYTPSSNLITKKSIPIS
jgi:subtilisin family serine protease